MSATATHFYVTGGTLRPDAPSYVERPADADLYEGLSRGEFCYVLTPRQMGKSSLMARIAHRLRGEGVAVVVLDLTRVGQNLSPEQWYDGLLALMGQQLDLEDELEAFWLEHPRLSPLQRWLAALQEVALRRVPGRIVIFVDEIDTVGSLPFSTDEFFAAIRACYNQRTEDPQFGRLAFCLLGVASPSDLIQDTRLTPFNIGRRIELTDFGAAEAVPLARGLGRHGKLAKALLARVLYWTGGHPYLTQRLCQAAADDASVTGNAGVDRLCEALFLSTRARERDDNLLFVRDRLLRSDADLSSLLGLYARVRRGQRVPNDEANPLVSLLRIAGITRVADGSLRVRNRIYERVFDEEWVRTNLPDAELRRQRAAYRRGLVRATGVAGVILAVVGGLALMAMNQAYRADRASRGETRQRRLAEENLYAARMPLALQAWEEGNLTRARALLEAERPRPGEPDLRGFEWRYLWRLCRDESRFTLRGHTGRIWSVAFSPNGKILASASADGTIRLWDLAARRELVSLKGKALPVESLAFSPDGKTFASGSNDGTIRLWDLTAWQKPASGAPASTAERVVPKPGVRGKPVASVLKGHSDSVGELAFSPNGKLLASASFDQSVKLWDLKSRRAVATLRGQALYGGVAFSPDGRILATCPRDHTIALWDVASRRELARLRGHTEWVGSVAFSPDGKLLASGSSDTTVRLWDPSRKREVATLPGHTFGVSQVAFSPDGRTLASASADKTIRLWDVASLRAVATLRGHTGEVWSVAFSPDGTTLASGGDDTAVKLWAVAGKRERDILRGNGASVSDAVFSPGGKTVAAGVGDTVRLWDVGSERVVATLRGGQGEIWCLAFSPDGKTLATGSPDRMVRLWDVATGRCVAVLRGHQKLVLSVAFSPDGKTLASGSDDHTARLWDLTTRQQIATFRHESNVAPVTFSPDGRTLATGSETVKLWDVATRRPLVTSLRSPPGFAIAAFFPDGLTLALGTADSSVMLWNLATRRPMTTFPAGATGPVAISPDGRTLAIGSNNTVKLWNLTIRQEVLTLKGHTGQVGGIAFSPDGNILATTGDGDGTVRLWRATPFAEADAQDGPRTRVSR